MKTLLFIISSLVLIVLLFVLIDAIVIDRLKESSKFYKWWKKHVCEKF